MHHYTVINDDNKSNTKNLIIIMISLDVLQVLKEHTLYGRVNRSISLIYTSVPATPKRSALLVYNKKVVPKLDYTNNFKNLLMNFYE